MIVIGLTGNIGSGKTTVAEVWRTLGATVLSADRVGEEVVHPGTQGLRRLVEALGPEILAPDGTMDRRRVAARVFRDPGALRALNAITHPLIVARLKERVEEERRRGAAVVVIEAALLFEFGDLTWFDALVVVDAPEAERLRRVMAQRGIGEEEARRIMAAQMDAAEKRRRAQYVIANDGDLDQLRRRAREVFQELRARAGGARGGR